MTHDLLTSCNESDMEMTIHYRVAPIMKLKGFGRGVIQRLVKTNIKKNLYFEIKEKDIEETLTGHMITKRRALVKVYGLNTNKEIRARLIEILYNRVNLHKDKFIAPILYEEMLGMQVKRNGKVEHSDNTHDDQVFSYLMAMYVWYDGKNVMENWNLMKNTIKTDEDEEIIDGDIERDSDIKTVDVGVAEIIEDDDVQSQLQYINDSNKRAVLYEDFEKQIREREDEQLRYMMGTDPTFRKAVNNAYHTPDNEAGIRTMILLPNEVFIDDEDMALEKQQELHGNLYNQFFNL